MWPFTFNLAIGLKIPSTEETGDAMMLNVCVTDTPGTATFHQVCLGDKKMNSIIFRKMPDVVIICHTLLSVKCFLTTVLMCGIMLMLYK